MSASNVKSSAPSLHHVWNRMRQLITSRIPMRETYCQFRQEMVFARIATADELEHLLSVATLGMLYIDVELKSSSLNGSSSSLATIQSVEATLKAVEPSGIIDIGTYSAQVKHMGEFDPIMNAQSNAIKGVLRNSGFRTENEVEDVADAKTVQVSDRIKENKVNVQDTKGHHVGDASGHSKDVVSREPLEHAESSKTEAELPETWIMPEKEQIAYVKSLMLMDTKPIDYINKLHDVIRAVRDNDPVLSSIPWKRFLVLILKDERPEDIPGRLKSCTTHQVELAITQLLRMK